MPAFCSRPKPCAVCGVEMLVKPSLWKRKKYCSKECALVGWKGQRRSRRTEFKKGLQPRNKKRIGDTYTTRDKNGARRTYIKIGEPRHWRLRARVVWEKAFGPIPKGCLIHHIDEDTANDHLSNLALMNRAGHLRIHRPDFEERRLAALQQPLCKQAQP